MDIDWKIFTTILREYEIHDVYNFIEYLMIHGTYTRTDAIMVLSKMYPVCKELKLSFNVILTSAEEFAMLSRMGVKTESGIIAIRKLLREVHD